MTWPFQNQLDYHTGKINPTSRIFMNGIHRFAGETGLREDILVDHAITHEVAHNTLMRRGYLALDYGSKNVHEDWAELVTFRGEHNPTLSAYMAFEMWTKYQLSGPAGTPTDSLADDFRQAAVQTFGQRGYSFIAEYAAKTAHNKETHSSLASHARGPDGKHVPHVQVYLDLLKKYAPQDPLGAENQLANNYARNLENNA